jgi:hypothetical protein
MIVPVRGLYFRKTSRIGSRLRDADGENMRAASCVRASRAVSLFSSVILLLNRERAEKKMQKRPPLQERRA